MNVRYLCVPCKGENCPRCGGRGWVIEARVQLERNDSLAETVAKSLVEKRIADIGQAEWGRRAATENMTVDQFTQLEVWQASGPVKYQFMTLTDEVLDALANLVGIKLPPHFVEDRPELTVVG
jgi:hypothetical protein